jgi:alpha-ribazole phosphatase
MERDTRLYLVRHGQVLGYEGFPIYGHTDVELTEVGIMQMEKLAERLHLSGIGAVYSSDLKRSLTGARMIARHHDVPIHAMPELREIYFGAWEGLTLQVIRERYPDALSARQADPLNYHPPGNGQSIGQLAESVSACFKSILEQQKGKDLLLVGHGVVNRVILCSALGLDLGRMFRLQQDYGCLNIIDYFPDSTLVRLING